MNEVNQAFSYIISGNIKWHLNGKEFGSLQENDMCIYTLTQKSTFKNLPQRYSSKNTKRLKYKSVNCSTICNRKRLKIIKMSTNKELGAI